MYKLLEMELCCLGTHLGRLLQKWPESLWTLSPAIQVNVVRHPWYQFSLCSTCIMPSQLGSVREINHREEIKLKW
jgi:hypothetical protein